ncbi:N-acetylmuramic acid 6-phosphate etherase [Paenibacillus sp. N1-5-1-14]|uniref:N-acetylmuramic acid 6-phosphate etherase n=1 Tax=Paenibacillus radicibacter TaxID=2972488 RepID=UPI002158DD0B|nr:N-acetylmuramic acid 6-phosphate etherase [Paenibacillus radicibacter]MCR8643633.1 N-acetylmuramic acid 6-phosphate etherase [Paenibacillus radicibacter]
MDEYLAGLTTEKVNESTLKIDESTTEQMLHLMNVQDTLVPAAVGAEIPQIAKAVDILHQALRNGGRMFYVGAGSSGRLGVLDASECPPTYGTDPEMVQGYIAGGDVALRTAVEGYEDSVEEGIALIERCGVTAKDVVVGITASGSAQFVIAALQKAKEIGAATISVVNNKDSKLIPVSDVCIAPIVGPEVIMGSTRLKAGTAQKLVLNMLTTCTMVKLGKTYNNLMVDLKASNIKLRDRSVRIIREATGVNEETASQFLESASKNCKLAIMMIKTGLDAAEAEALLEQSEGSLKTAISSFSKVV